MRRSLRRTAAGTSDAQQPGTRHVRAGRTTDPAGLQEVAPARTDWVVVDASTVSKWFLPELHSEAARRLIGGAFRIYVPDLVFSEIGALLQRRVADGELTDFEALSILQVLSKMPLEVHRTWPLGPIALELRRSLDNGMYECIYVALALREGAIFVTADPLLYEGLSRTPLSQYIRWIEDIPSMA